MNDASSTIIIHLTAIFVTFVCITKKSLSGVYLGNHYDYYFINVFHSMEMDAK